MTRNPDILKNAKGVGGVSPVGAIASAFVIGKLPLYNGLIENFPITTAAGRGYPTGYQGGFSISWVSLQPERRSRLSRPLHFDKVLQPIFSYGIVIFGVKITRRLIPARVLPSGVLTEDAIGGGKHKTKYEEVCEDGSYLHETAS
ncbi:hypothetical protein O9H85_07830 [Paenibacillus filicis]|uniref:Uncharacterized protein n=1 Tax=Paenibacillus gyeongsangnamensis TaxID=3388067 RepID=A0ABT4Q645_9BACL|nr:hypothetical protein [Paenibacillus filicis]MCZ8512340.1 hypothetical protein [Paenibacillus filicis]